MNLLEIYNAKTPDDAHSIIMNYLKTTAHFCNDAFSYKISSDKAVSYFHENNAPSILKIPFGDEFIEINVVSEKSLYSQDDGVFYEKIDDDYFFFSTGNDMTASSIARILLSNLWYQSITPHVNFVASIYRCGEKKTYVDSMLVAAWGMKQMSYDNKINEEDDVRQKTVTTGFFYLSDIFNYIDNDFDIFPNGVNFDVGTLIDYLFISIVHTHYLASVHYKMNIIINDDIIIEWIDNTYCGKKSLNDITHFTYEVDKNKYLTVPNYGFIPKLDDLKRTVINPIKNFYIASGKLTNNHPASYAIIFGRIFKSVTLKHLKKSQIFNLIDAFDNFSLDGKFVGKLPSAIEILNHQTFDKYKTTEVPSNSFLIKMI